MAACCVRRTCRPVCRWRRASWKGCRSTPTGRPDFLVPEPPIPHGIPLTRLEPAMTITWHRNEDGTGTTTVAPVAPGQQADVTLVDDTRQARSAWAESLRAQYRRACWAAD